MPLALLRVGTHLHRCTHPHSCTLTAHALRLPALRMCMCVC